MRQMFKTEEKTITTVDLGDVTFEVVTIGEKVQAIGPVRSTKAVGKEDKEAGIVAGAVLVPMVDPLLFSRVAAAVEAIRKEHGDYRGVCPVHGWIAEYTTVCSHEDHFPKQPKEEPAEKSVSPSDGLGSMPL